MQSKKITKSEKRRIDYMKQIDKEFEEMEIERKREEAEDLKNARYFRTFKGKKYPITMKNFIACIPWKQIENMMMKRDYNKFVKWMFGQTCPIGGVYTWDFEQFLRGGKQYD